MKNDLSCEVVRDLLPSYVDELLSDVSRRAVDTHLETCETCREAVSEMKRAVETPQQEEEDLFFLGAFRKLNLQYRFVIIFAVCIVLLLPTVTIASTLYGWWSSRVYDVIPEQITYQVAENGIQVEGILPDGYYGDYEYWSYDLESGRLTLHARAHKDAEGEASGWEADYRYEFIHDKNNYTAPELSDISELWVNGMDTPLWVAEEEIID